MFYINIYNAPKYKTTYTNSILVESMLHEANKQEKSFNITWSKKALICMFYINIYSAFIQLNILRICSRSISVFNITIWFTNQQLRFSQHPCLYNFTVEDKEQTNAPKYKTTYTNSILVESMLHEANKQEKSFNITWSKKARKIKSSKIWWHINNFMRTQ
jgi:hypothetical protein